MRFNRGSVILTTIFLGMSLLLGVLAATLLTVSALALMALITASRRPNPVAQHSHREPKHRA